MFEKLKARIWARRLGKKTGQAVGVGFIKSDDRKKAAFDAWVEQCAQTMQPNAHSIDEVQAWLKANYRTKPAAFSQTRLQMMTADIVMNFFPETLQTRATPPKDESYREFERWSMESEKVRTEAMAVDPDGLGLEFFGYQVLLGEDMDIEVVFERKSGQVSVSGACPGMGNPAAERFLLELAKYHGVTQADIDGKTPRFLGYITAMRDAGEDGFFMEPMQ